MKNTVETYVRKMEDSKILLEKEMYFAEYADDVVKFQQMIVELLMADAYEDGMRINETIFKLEAKARAMGISENYIFRKGISALEIVAKETGICIAGKAGENKIAKALQYVERPYISTYRNVSVSNGRAETELDNVVLTETGIVILEIKRSRDDLTITPEGYLVHSRGECYDLTPLPDKMSKKRRLLKEKLETMLAEKNLNIPIRVESFIVFASPKGQRIEVTDCCYKEKWCYGSGLRKKMEYYIGPSSYKQEQLSVLEDVLSQMETQVKRFRLNVNYDAIRKDIAEMIVLLEETASSNSESHPVNAENNAVKTCDNVIDYREVRKQRMEAMRMASIMVGSFAGLACVGAMGVATYLVRKK